MSANDFNDLVELYDRAMKTRDALDFATAVDLFQQALTIMPRLERNLPFQVAFLYDMALACDLAGLTDRAMELFEYSVELYEQFRLEDPNHDAVEGFSGLIWGINDYLDIKRKADLLADNYIDSIIPRRWEEDRMPLKIFVDKTPDTGFDTTLSATILESFQCWISNQTFLSWVETNDRKQAAIVVSRVSDGLGSAGGHTAFEDVSDANGNVHLHLVDVRISMHSHDSSVYKPSELRAFQSLTLHEAGHALGLDGHSPHASDLMYWKSPILNLSDRDTQTLRLLYSERNV